MFIIFPTTSPQNTIRFVMCTRTSQRDDSPFHAKYDNNDKNWTASHHVHQCPHRMDIHTIWHHHRWPMVVSYSYIYQNRQHKILSAFEYCNSRHLHLSKWHRILHSHSFVPMYS